MAEIRLEGPAVLERDLVDPAGQRPDRRALATLLVLQLGAVVIVLAASTWRAFELDRFFVPKELVLHVAALLAAAAGGAALRRAAHARLDVLLIAFVLLSAVSAALATNPWLGVRAVAISASGILLFLCGRFVREAGLDRPLLAALALAVVLGSATALLQAYGVRTDFFSLNRAPGGTFGNRNFVAHMAAFGLPVILACGLRARTSGGFALAALGAAVAATTLVLTRSRAAWLAFAAVAVVCGVALLAAPALRRDARTWLRMAGLITLAVVGIGAALLLPNTLRWRSDSPYLDSVRGVTNYQEGSGRGRLVQYRRSLAMTAAHPVLGVGPGNWSVVYPAHADGGDPSLDRTAPGTTSNPWPSSDWVAFVAERGVVATLFLALALLVLAGSAARRLRRTDDRDEALCAMALAATLAAAVVAGMFDAVMLLATPTYLVWTAAGALWLPFGAVPGNRPALRTTGLALLMVIALGGALRSTAQLVAIALHAQDDAGMLRLAARIDPGNYRVHLALAREGGREQRCRHAEAAHRLLPEARAPGSLRRGCR